MESTVLWNRRIKNSLMGAVLPKFLQDALAELKKDVDNFDGK